jgi:septum formation protein
MGNRNSYFSKEILMELILASTSPRRKEIMNYFSFPFRQMSPEFDEESIPYKNDPQRYVEELALAKAKSARQKEPDALLISADTVVSLDNKILGKPKDENELFAMLQALSGRRHSVWTGVAASNKEAYFVESEETVVVCNTLTPDELHRYVRSHALYDKAGGYAIQKSGSVLVKSIQGCYYNVCGLPINALIKVMRQVGIDLWDYLKEFE